jgi:hypothetical protein
LSQDPGIWKCTGLGRVCNLMKRLICL